MGQMTEMSQWKKTGR